MTFRNDVNTDFENILEGEFSSRVVFHLDSGDWDTYGIFDETYEEIQLEEGGPIGTAQIARIVIYYGNRTADIPHKTRCTVYHDGETLDFRVLEVQDESEGNASVKLERPPT